MNVNADFHTLDDFWWLPPSKRPTNEQLRMYQEPRTHEEVAPLRESNADVEQRIRALVAKLNELPHTHIAIVGHSSFFKRMLGMNRKLHNCELVEVPFAQVARRFGIVPRDS